MNGKILRDHQVVDAPIVPGFQFMDHNTVILKGDIYFSPHVLEWTPNYALSLDLYVGKTFIGAGATEAYGMYRPIVKGYYELSNPETVITHDDRVSWGDNDAMGQYSRSITYVDTECLDWRLLKDWTRPKGATFRLWRLAGKRIRNPSPGNLKYAEPLPLP